MTDRRPDTTPTNLLTRCWLYLLSDPLRRRIVLGVAGLVACLALFYGVENWRGERTWRRCEQNLIAAGYELDWTKLIPPELPEAQNIFKAPQMEDWFVRQSSSSLSGGGRAPATNFWSQLQHPSLAFFGAQSRITIVASATEFLQWSDQFAMEFDLIRTGLRRPYARIPGEYTHPYLIPIPNFVALRIVAQTQAQRAHCHLLVGEPAAALADLTLVHDLRKFLLAEPSGTPMTLVSAMINVAVSGLYAGVIQEGLAEKRWTDEQLRVLQSQLLAKDLMTPVRAAFHGELAASTYTFQHEPLYKLLHLRSGNSSAPNNAGLFQKLCHQMQQIGPNLNSLAPRGWTYQNLATYARLQDMILESLGPSPQVFSPTRLDSAQKNLTTELAHPSPFTLIARFAIPNSLKAMQSAARNQTAINEAAIAVGLERYRLVHGNYPATLAALVPDYSPRLPLDVIGGQPYHYQDRADGSFLLYSVGWNEKDDGGTGSPGTSGTGTFNPNTSDWVW